MQLSNIMSNTCICNVLFTILGFDVPMSIQSEKNNRKFLILALFNVIIESAILENRTNPKICNFKVRCHFLEATC